MEKLHGLDLFSGIGGNTLALRDWVKTIAYCEFERHAQGVLLSRMRAGDIKPAPIWDDVTTLTKDQFTQPIDIVMGGFPCQDISVAGKGAGITPETRSGLFYQVLRLVKELRPTFVFLENVPAIRKRGLNVVLYELTQAGYDCRWTMLSAASVGACHKRERWFLLASNTLQIDLSQQCRGWAGSDRESALQRLQAGSDGRFRGSSKGFVQPRVGRDGDGISHRVDRIGRIGNAVVPEQALIAFEILVGLK